MGQPLWKYQIPLNLVNPSLPFEILEIDFVRPFPLREKISRAKYIIIVVEYLTKWVESKPIESFTKEVAVGFIYENIITRFGCLLTLFNNQGNHLVNGTIKILLEKSMIDHNKTSPYHPEVNGVVEPFN